MKRRATGGSAVRILAGRWKGRRLEVPSAARPTSGRAREALFSLLQDRLPGARVLDLYAGSGAVGLEAVSRGAALAVLVERDAGPLREALGRLQADASEVRVLAIAATEAVAQLIAAGERFDIVFADPPYDASGDGDNAKLAGLVAPDGIVVLQRDAGEEGSPAPAGLRLLQRRAYGRNVFHFLRIL